jgi:tRNA A58 N-methylase Trm61
MEKFVKDSLMNHMESNQLFTKGQHGFRKGRSCITQLIEVMEDWTEHLDNHNSVDAIYLDFQKAFDTVPHHRLFTKLKGYGYLEISLSGSITSYRNVSKKWYISL